jgi:hypothetical protein
MAQINKKAEIVSLDIPQLTNIINLFKQKFIILSFRVFFEDIPVIVYGTTWKKLKKNLLYFSNGYYYFEGFT